MFKAFLLSGALLALFLTISCDTKDRQSSNVSQEYDLVVYKSPTCGCCKTWITHLEKSGFTIDAVDSDNMSQIKQELGVSPIVQSCHTAKGKAGFVFEGHVPAKAIRQFLAAPPENAIGLSVPGMPVGSPGMEMGDKFDPYEVLVLLNNGNVETFMKFDTYESQF